MRNRYQILFLAAISYSLILAGLVCGQPEERLQAEFNYIYNIDQDVEGAGFFSAYQKTAADGLELSNTAHGSGSYEHESMLNSRKGVKFDTDKDEYTVASDMGTAFTESTDFSYSPSKMQMGKHSLPIAFQSRGAEETCLENYISGISMNARFNYIDTLSKNLSAGLYWKFADDPDEFESSLEDQTKTDLSLEASFSGSGHVGVLGKSWDQKSADIFIDEDYRGTYYLTKNMSHEVKYNLMQEIDYWLPCCSGGFADMNALDKKLIKSATGVFDCTCFKAVDEAQFPRVY